MNLIMQLVKNNQINPSSIHSRPSNLLSKIIQKIVGQKSIPKRQGHPDKKILFFNQGSKKHSKTKDQSNSYSQSIELNFLLPAQNYFIFDSKVSQVRTHD